MKDTVSCTEDQIYEKYGLSMFDKREIKFEDYNNQIKQYSYHKVLNQINK